MAEKYYENEEWRRASTLFEQIQPQYRGKPQGERITFFYANSLLNRKNYVLAAFQFESFVKSYEELLNSKLKFQKLFGNGNSANFICDKIIDEIR